MGNKNEKSANTADDVSRETPDDSIARRLADKGVVLGELVRSKNLAYGNSVDTSARAFELLFPDGIPKDKFVQALLLVRIWDKMMRIATQEEAFEESPFDDIAGYGILGSVLGEVRKGD